MVETRTIVLMGVAGCGKSTIMHALDDRLGWRWAEGDDFHPPANVAKMASGHPLTDEDRWPWLRAIAAWIGEQETAGANALVTCSALRRPYRDLLRDGHPSVWFAHLSAPREVIADRLDRRKGHYMPPALLGSQIDTLEPLGPDEPGALIDVTGGVDEAVAEILARIPPAT